MLGRVVSSYTPTIRALAHGRARRAGGARPVLIGVALRDSPGEGLATLVNAPAEVRAVADALGLPSEVLDGADAASGAVAAWLSCATWLCVAWHARGDASDPSAAGLLLADHERRPLAVLDIARTRSPRTAPFARYAAGRMFGMRGLGCWNGSDRRSASSDFRRQSRSGLIARNFVSPTGRR